MIKFALGFVFGAWLLQQQAALPNLYWFLVIFPALFFVVKSRTLSFQNSAPLQKISVFVFASLLGFLWAATFATIRLSDELPSDWQQKSINIIGVIATLPEITEKGERFQFDVEKTLTQGAKIPRHISLNFYGESNTPSAVNHFHAGERWNFL